MLLVFSEVEGVLSEDERVIPDDEQVLGIGLLSRFAEIEAPGNHHPMVNQDDFVVGNGMSRINQDHGPLIL